MLLYGAETADEGRRVLRSRSAGFGLAAAGVRAIRRATRHIRQRRRAHLSGEVRDVSSAGPGRADEPPDVPGGPAVGAIYPGAGRDEEHAALAPRQDHRHSELR